MELIEFFDLCPECGKHKAARFDCDGKEKVVRFSCDCNAVADDSDNTIKIERNMKECFENRKIHGTFSKNDGLNPKVSDLCYRYAKALTKRSSFDNGLLLYSRPDQGKTFAAECIADKAIKEGLRVLFKTSSEYVEMSQASMWSGGWLCDLSRYDLIVIDDLGAERGTEYAVSAIESLIDRIYTLRKPFVITTNATLEEIAKPESIQSQRIYGRILERCVIANFDCGRKRATKETLKQNKKKLDL